MRGGHMATKFQSPPMHWKLASLAMFAALGSTLLGGVFLCGGAFAAPPATIGDYVWFDLNHDGIHEPDEPPIPGVTVHLLDVDGHPVLDPITNQPITATTNAEGKHDFSVVPNTTYKVRFDASTADTTGLPGHPDSHLLLPTMQHADVDPSKDSDVDPASLTAIVHSGPPGSTVTVHEGAYEPPHSR